MRKALFALAALLLAEGRGWATTIQIQLDATTLTASAGDTVTFTGVIVNSDLMLVDLNGIDITLNGMLTFDPSPFFLGPPTVDASTPTVQAETVDFPLFTVTVADPYTDPFGPQSGTLTILGGEEGAGGYDPTTQNVLGSAQFNVNVQTPEPSTFAMMTAAAGLLFLYRRAASSKTGKRYHNRP
jgi:hypothetical protein